VAGVDELAQQWRRRESRIVEALVKNATDVQVCVETDEIGQLERAHGVM
jgi:hypothetical protein